MSWGGCSRRLDDAKRLTTFLKLATDTQCSCRRRKMFATLAVALAEASITRLLGVPHTNRPWPRRRHQHRPIAWSGGRRAATIIMLGLASIFLDYFALMRCFSHLLPGDRFDVA